MSFNEEDQDEKILNEEELPEEDQYLDDEEDMQDDEEEELTGDIPDNDTADEEFDDLEAKDNNNNTKKKKDNKKKPGNLLSDLGLAQPDTEPEKEQLTDSAKSNLFENFLREFKDAKTKEYKYFEKIQTIAYQSIPVLEVDYNDILVYSGSDNLLPLFYEDIDTALSTIKDATESVIFEINSDYKPEYSNLAIRIANFDIKRSFREIDADLIDKMVTIDAIVNRSTKKKPWLVASVYRCKNCK